jgi:hypothetical protein
MTRPNACLGSICRLSNGRDTLLWFCKDFTNRLWKWERRRDEIAVSSFRERSGADRRFEHSNLAVEYLRFPLKRRYY